MLGLWLNDMESLEAISQDDEARRIFLRMAALSRDGQMGNFLTELAQDEDLDDETKGTLRELAEDNTFLLAVEDYLARRLGREPLERTFTAKRLGERLSGRIAILTL